MKVYKITDKEFRDYGRMLDGYDYGELFKILKTTEIPEKEIFYTASDARLEETAVAEEMRESHKRTFRKKFPLFLCTRP